MVRLTSNMFNVDSMLSTKHFSLLALARYLTKFSTTQFTDFEFTRPRRSSSHFTATQKLLLFSKIISEKEPFPAGAKKDSHKVLEKEKNSEKILVKKLYLGDANRL